MTAVLFVLIVSSTASPAAGNPFHQSLRQGEPSQAYCVRQLPRKGSFKHLPVRSKKAPPFGGAGIEQSEMTERVISAFSAAVRTAPD